MGTDEEKPCGGKGEVLNLNDFRKSGQDSTGRNTASPDAIPTVSLPALEPVLSLPDHITRPEYAIPTTDEMFGGAQERLLVASSLPPEAPASVPSRNPARKTIARIFRSLEKLVLHIR